MTLALEYEMTYASTIEGPIGPTTGSPLGERVCWQVVTASLRGPRIDATLAMPGTDWIRLGPDGIRRQDLRAQLITDDGELILFRYDLALIRSTERFLAALAAGEPIEFDDQYMRMAPHFEVGAGRHAWLGESLFVGRAGSRGETRSPTSSAACSERHPASAARPVPLVRRPLGRAYSGHLAVRTAAKCHLGERAIWRSQRMPIGCGDALETWHRARRASAYARRRSDQCVPAENSRQTLRP